MEKVYEQLTAEFPDVLQDESQSLKQLSVEVLEKSSQMDMLVCQLMMRMVELWNGEVPDVMAPSKKKKNRSTNDESVFPIVCLFGFRFIYSSIRCNIICVE